MFDLHQLFTLVLFATILLTGCVPAQRGSGAAGLDAERPGAEGLVHPFDELTRHWEPEQIPDVPPGPTWREVDGVRYGAEPDERGPIGGGAGYHEILTDGDYRVANAEELIDALERVEAGQVIFVEPDAEIDMTVRVGAEGMVLKLPAGVTLASNRGENGATGGLIYSDAFHTSPLFDVTGPGVRVTGVRLRGPDPKRRTDLHMLSFYGPDARGSEYYYQFPNSGALVTDVDRLVVDNCEISAWSHAGIYLRGGVDHHIHHNHIHHNQRDGLGYGITHNVSESLVEYNLFHHHRHPIAATGSPGSGYEARHNVVIGEGNAHHFDVHGGRDRQDGTEIAGTWFKIYRNTFYTRETMALKVRGEPEEYVNVHHNWFSHAQPGSHAVYPEGITALHSNIYGPAPTRSADAVHATVDIVTHPSIAPGLSAEQAVGEVRLSLVNHSDSRQAGTLHPQVEPADEATIASGSAIRYDLAAGETTEVRLPITASPDVSVTALSVTVPATADGAVLDAATLDPPALLVPVVDRPLAVWPALSDPDDLDAAARLLAERDARPVTLGERAVGTVRFAVTADALLVQVEVHDANVQPRDVPWEGSCVELFVATPEAEGVTQLFLVPEPDTGGVRVTRPDGEAYLEVPGVTAESETTDTGYRLTARLPRETVNLPADADAVWLEFQLSSAASADAAQRDYVTLFGSRLAYMDTTRYSRFKLVPAAEAGDAAP